MKFNKILDSIKARFKRSNPTHPGIKRIAYPEATISLLNPDQQGRLPYQIPPPSATSTFDLKRSMQYLTSLEEELGFKIRNNDERRVIPARDSEGNFYQWPEIPKPPVDLRRAYPGEDPPICIRCDAMLCHCPERAADGSWNGDPQTDPTAIHLDSRVLRKAIAAYNSTRRLETPLDAVNLNRCPACNKEATGKFNEIQCCAFCVADGTLRKLLAHWDCDSCKHLVQGFRHHRPDCPIVLATEKAFRDELAKPENQ